MHLDGESNPIRVDICYEARGYTLSSAIREIKAAHGPDVKLLPLSGKSAGGGVFQVTPSQGETIVGLSIPAAVTPKIRHAIDVDIRQVEIEEIVIDETNCFIYAGAAITLQQLNQSLADELGAQYKVLGADLTSYTYAQVGSTFMTGGMGPQRRYFSDSVVEISLHDGDNKNSISGKNLQNFSGTYGWTGIVSAVKCRYVELPLQEFAFSLPVKNTPDNIASVLSHFSGFVYLEDELQSSVQTKNGGSSLILGLEHITVDSMQPLLNSHQGNTSTRIAAEILDQCNAVKADGMIFINGHSELPIDEIISEFVDDLTSENLTMAGIDLDYTYYFPDLDVMRDLREAVSYAIRNQEPKGSFSYKGHTDANIWINPASLEASVKNIWQAYLDYIDHVQNYFKSQPAIKGEILIYGHLNPVGFDPHNRITFATEDKSIYDSAIRQLDGFKNRLTLRLADICESSGSIFTGGEKGAGSDHELLMAFDDPSAAPRPLSTKFKQQCIAIQKASPSFNWRALPPYI